VIRSTTILVNAALAVALLIEAVSTASQSIGLLGSTEDEFGLAGSVGLPIAAVVFVAAALCVIGIRQLARGRGRTTLLVADLVSIAVVLFFLAPTTAYDPGSIISMPIRGAALVLAIAGAVLVGSPALRTGRS
jgi:hypothetical protein